MNCSKCNAWVPDDAVFCPECGQPIETIAHNKHSAQMFCAGCGSPISEGDAFCGNCGTKISAPSQSNPPKKAKPAKAHGPKMNIRKLLTLGAVIAAVIVVLVFLLPMISGSFGAKSHVLYVKDGQMQGLELPDGKEAFEITSRLLDGDYTEIETQSNLYLSAYIQKSSDGKKLFYPDRIESYEYGSIKEFTLYYRDLNKDDQEPVKIDSGVSYYTISEKGTLVTYSKGGNLYQHDLSDKTKIASDVVDFGLYTDFVASEDHKKVIYATSEGEGYFDLYLKALGEEEQKIAANVTRVDFVSDDFSVIVYRKDDSLYIKKGNEDAMKIDSDVQSVITANDDGEVYYTTCEEPELTYWSFIQEDADDGYAEYYQEQLEGLTMSNPVTTLCYFDGSQATVITENMVDYFHAGSRSIVYAEYDSDSLPKVKLSEYNGDSYSVYLHVEEELAQNVAMYLATGSTAETLNLEDIRRVHVADEGKMLYVLANHDEEEKTCSIYAVTIDDGKMKSCELYDDDVYASISGIIDSAFLYFKDYEDGCGELYMNGEKIADDVANNYIDYISENNRLYYMQDWDSEKEQGTFRYYNGKEHITVKDDVHDVVCTPDKDMLFLYDYNINNFKGELWIQSGKKVTKLDDDVVNILAAR